MKKSYKLIIVIGIILLLLLSLFLALRDSGQNSPSAPPGNNLTLPASGGPVFVKDFFKEILGQAGDTFIVAEDPNYDIVYYKKDNSFTITLGGMEPIKSRALAEEKFLQALNVNFADACKLKVGLFVPYSIDPELSGKDYGLSFCPNGIQF